VRIGAGAAAAGAAGHKAPWWEALAALDRAELFLLFGVSALVLIFQEGGGGRRLWL
jgi:hypothetical protein